MVTEHISCFSISCFSVGDRGVSSDPPPPPPAASPSPLFRLRQKSLSPRMLAPEAPENQWCSLPSSLCCLPAPSLPWAVLEQREASFSR